LRFQIGDFRFQIGFQIGGVESEMESEIRNPKI
jgi:hypothetical protein